MALPELGAKSAANKSGHGRIRPGEVRRWRICGPERRANRGERNYLACSSRAAHIFAPTFKIEVEREDDVWWIGEVPTLPGALAYGATEAEARARVAALALRVVADRIEHGEPVPAEAAGLFAAA
ncbi:MAG: type II toxin-antitoxin system HicB family antitoxin [Acetobacteraceae bacterium]